MGQKGINGMKLHIFVATTQGLVAVQKIYEQDPEIGSVVSINGTATISPITQAYKSFVNKGAGIIAADFGGSSYRVNISGQIDQGNSWQLGFYLAHAVNVQGLLGNGDVTNDDMVIVATGEINTSERNVLAVEEVPLKLKKANQIACHWPQSVKKLFFIPAENKLSVVNENSFLELKFIRVLDEVFSYFPIADISKPKMNKAKYYALLGLMGVATLFATYQLNWLGLPDSPKEFKQVLAPQFMRQADSSIPKSTTGNPMLPSVIPQKSSAEKPLAQLTLAYGIDRGCDNNKRTYLKVAASLSRFDTAEYSGLCEIIFSGLANVSTVIAINRHSHRYIFATKSNQQFILPAPSVAAEYLIIALEKDLSDASKQQLRSYLFNLPAQMVISTESIKEISLFKGNQLQIYKHQLKNI